MTMFYEKNIEAAPNEIREAMRGQPIGEAVKNVANMFGIRSSTQLFGDLGSALRRQGSGFQFGVSSLGFLRPDISIPTYQGKRPMNGLAPIYHCFDKVGGGKGYSQRVTRKTSRDFRGKGLTYDEHDGVDFVCPVGTELVAAAPGTVVMIRDTWLRGGLTVAVDHGDGVLTQYTHCWKAQVCLGQKVRRGEVVALSGVSGMDMTIFCPWIPPHIHFMVWENGVPLDPFNSGNSSWYSPDGGGMPVPVTATDAFEEESIPGMSTVDTQVINDIISQCIDTAVRDQLHALDGHNEYIVALLEDSLHHDKWAWPEALRGISLRLQKGKGRRQLTLPLSSDFYRGAFFADEKIPKHNFWA